MSRAGTLRPMLWGGLCALLLGGCMPEDMGPMPRLAAPMWQDGERTVYTVTRNDSTLYRATLTLRFDEEQAQPSGSQAQGGVVPTAVMTYVVEPVTSAQYLFDSATVVFRRDDFQALRSYRSISNELSDVDLEAHYQQQRVVIHKQTVDGNIDESLRLPPRCFVSDLLPTALRAVPPQPGSSFRINLVVPSEFRVVPVRVSVLGTKLVKSGAGDIVCREIVATFPGREVRYWYEAAEPHRFIGYHDMESEIEVHMESYSPAFADSLTPAPTQ